MSWLDNYFYMPAGAVHYRFMRGARWTCYHADRREWAVYCATRPLYRRMSNADTYEEAILFARFFYDNNLHIQPKQRP